MVQVQLFASHINRYLMIQLRQHIVNKLYGYLLFRNQLNLRIFELYLLRRATSQDL